ncbi:N-acetylmuramoyl-L-alanine amidase [Pseudomonas fluorescens]|uniref:N-acetylmuramoyl-L-alanine amidase n=1 Tax=Pseudomonas fluorescens TaxID=294 RepID=A0A5E7BNR0_PSEFL|nr:N-acetylmuramoyl-L-alanine amidase [Pseudomonas fluorescens]VVN86313.1 N-acetylmuramoyl-L-alanine amidase AmiD [Pseudomonas fluorescens]
MIPIDATTYRSRNGFNSRVRFLILHYTAGNFSSSVNALTGPEVSAHYLVPDITDQSYLKAGHSDQAIFNLVDETQRAWHAGPSQWGSRSNLNDTSIGIEIVNVASFNQGKFTFPPYHPKQITAIEALALNILERYPDITPTQVLGHSDIAIGRKSDPGPQFPWHALYLKGIGAWFDDATRNAIQQQYVKSGIPARTELLKMFKTYGYDVSGVTGVPDEKIEQGFTQLVRAFQLHFRPEKYDGIMDAQTAANLTALVRKYFP